MEAVTILFSYVKQMAWNATPVILAVMAARLLIGRASKGLSYMLWIIVAVRLCCPVLPVSGISLYGLIPGGQAGSGAVWEPAGPVRYDSVPGDGSDEQAFAGSVQYDNVTGNGSEQEPGVPVQYDSVPGDDIEQETARRKTEPIADPQKPDAVYAAGGQNAASAGVSGSNQSGTDASDPGWPGTDVPGLNQPGVDVSDPNRSGMNVSDRTQPGTDVSDQSQTDANVSGPDQSDTDASDLYTHHTPDASYVAALATRYAAIADQRGWFCRIWLAGVVLMAGYAVLTCIWLKRKLRCAIRISEGVFECGYVHSPFLFGFLRPAIYLPCHLTAREQSYILAHERYHLRRRDYLIKWLAYALLAIYWFHPLVWTAFVLMNRDMELSCDAHVLKDLNSGERKEYSRLLLRFSCEKQTAVAAGPCFGEHEIRSRIRHALAPKKQAAGACAVAAAFLVLLATICLTNDEESDRTGPDTAGSVTETEGIENAESLRRRQAEALLAAANPYIGDAPADGRLLQAIWEVTGDPGARGTTELQTTEEPYGITLHFEELPDRERMWKSAVLFLALTGNCGEFGWDYELSEGDVCFFRVLLTDVNTALGVDVKDYAASVERVEELLRLLDGYDRNTPAILSGSTGGTVFPVGICTRESSEELRNELLPRLPADPAEMETKAVILRDEPEHMELWETFYQKVQAGVPADLLLACPRSREDGEGCFYTYVSYDGDSFYVVWDDLSIIPGDPPEDGKPVYQETVYSNLLVENYETPTGETFLTVTLDNDPELSWKEIEESWLSSVKPSTLDVHNLLFVELQQ